MREIRTADTVALSILIGKICVTPNAIISYTISFPFLLKCFELTGCYISLIIQRANLPTAELPLITLHFSFVSLKCGLLALSSVMRRVGVGWVELSANFVPN